MCDGGGGGGWWEWDSTDSKMGVRVTVVMVVGGSGIVLTVRWVCA